MSGSSYVHNRGVHTAFEVAEVFRDYGDAYLAQYPVTAEQAQVMRDIVNCRTGVLGGQVYECLNCGAVSLAYHSCRNRHCPKCQKFERAQWVEQQKALLLPIPYFHVVFTTGHEINAWVPLNRKVLYNLLLWVAKTVLERFAAQVLGGELGMSAVLHTWSQTLLMHIHAHFIVTGGALSFDGQRWVRCRPGYLFDIVAVAVAFREAFCDGLLQLAATGQLVGVVLAEAEQVVGEMRAKAWEVFAKVFEEPGAVYAYLSRYVHAVAISNYRITNIAEGQVSFTYYDNPGGGEKKEMTLTAVEFIRRFLLHVLPAKFWRIRHYGLHHSSARARKLPRARVLLGLPAAVPEIPKLVLAEWLEEVVGEKLHQCHFCGAFGSMTYRWEVGQMPGWWLWLKVLVGGLFGEALRVWAQGRWRDEAEAERREWGAAVAA